jgi:PAS domain S-box-containing protein
MHAEADIDNRAAHRHYSVNRTLAVGLSGIVVLVLFLTLSLIVVMRYDSQREREIRERHFPRLATAQAMRAAVADQQLGLRGFIISGDERFIDSFESGRAAFLRTSAELQAGPQLTSSSAALLQEQIAIAEAWYAEIAAPEIQAVQAGTLTAEQQRSTIAESTTRVDAFTAVNAAYQQDILDHIDATTADLERLRRTSFAAALGGGALVIFLTAFVSWRIVRAIRAPLGDLTQVVSAVDTGDRQRRVPRLAAAEFDQLGQGMNRMLDSLEQRIEEAQIQRSRLATIVDSANDGIIVIDANGIVTNINPAAARLFATTPDSATGQPITDLGLFTEQESRSLLLRARAGTAQPVVRRRGERVLSATVSALPGDDEADPRPGAVLVLRDVTELARIDEMKNEFISVVSHELRTPLTAIKGFTDLILEGEVGEITPAQREFLDIVQSNSNRLVALINDMLDISRIESGRIVLALEDIALPAIFERAVTNLRPLLDEKGLNVQMELDPDLPAVIGDEARLLQVLTNLLSNACKYTEHGGWITLRAEPLDGQAAVSVSDTGIGIPPEALPQVFSKFYRVDQPGTQRVGGTGLGLAITKSLVELHGGRVNIASRVGVGTTVRFTLPTTGSRGVDRAATPSIGTAMPLVLLAAPDSPARPALVNALARIPAEVRQARTPTAAGVVADAELRPPDLIVTLISPNGTAVDVAELFAEVRGHPVLSSTPIVVVGDASPSTLDIVTALPADLSPEAIAAEIRAHLPAAVADRPARGRVLVAEDDVDAGAWLQRILTAHGYDVTLVTDGLAAIVRAIEILPDAIVLDANMPKMGANEVLPQLRGNPGTRDLPVIVVSGTIPDAGPYFIELGANDFIAKPCEAEDILGRLAQQLRRPLNGENPPR